MNATANALKGQELKKDNTFIDSLNAYTKQATATLYEETIWEKAKEETRKKTGSKETARNRTTTKVITRERTRCKRKSYLKRRET